MSENQEGSPEIQLDQEKPTKIDFNKLSFQQLEKAMEVIGTSFKRTENGFYNALGQGISLRYTDKGFVLDHISIPGFLRHEQNSIMPKKSTNKEEMLQAIEKKLKEYNLRIIE